MRASVVIVMAIFSLLLFSACSKVLQGSSTNQQQAPQVQQPAENQASSADAQIQPETETTGYIDSQIVDPAQDIEIGQMI